MCTTARQRRLRYRHRTCANGRWLSAATIPWCVRSAVGCSFGSPATCPRSRHFARLSQTTPTTWSILQFAAAGRRHVHGDADEAIRVPASAPTSSAPVPPKPTSSLRHAALRALSAETTRRRSSGASSRSATFNDSALHLHHAHRRLRQPRPHGRGPRHLRKVREISPHLTIKLIEDGVAREDGFAWAVIPGLRKAGLPER